LTLALATANRQRGVRQIPNGPDPIRDAQAVVSDDTLSIRLAPPTPGQRESPARFSSHRAPTPIGNVRLAGAHILVKAVPRPQIATHHAGLARITGAFFDPGGSNYRGRPPNMAPEPPLLPAGWQGATP